jgi:hypothetical protein
MVVVQLNMSKPFIVYQKHKRYYRKGRNGIMIFNKSKKTPAPKLNGSECRVY